jgi:hypothetical protein
MKHTFTVIVTRILSVSEQHRPLQQPATHDAAACGRQDTDKLQNSLGPVAEVVDP